jgi:hypothetical protein
MLVRGDPPYGFADPLLKSGSCPDEIALTVLKGVRLRARLPAYLAQRRDLLAHRPLLPPLQHLVSSCEEPTTTDDIWATELGDL